MISENLGQIFANLSIITFNYDRCIKHFLFHAIQDWAQKGGSEVAKLFERRKLNIFHPYGVVGRLPWQEVNSKLTVHFGDYDDTLENLVGQIKTYHERLEAREEQDELYLMREALWKAENVIFLGFHFHKQNMELLKALDDPPKKLPHAYATVMGRSGADVEIIKKNIRVSLRREGTGEIVDTVDGDCKALFREYQARWML